MIKLRDSLSRKLTAMNMLVSGGALLCASIAFFSYELVAYRTNVILSRGTEAQIVGANSVSPLIFNDPKSAENTLSALTVSKHVTYAGIYTMKGEFFAGYWRGQARPPFPLPPLFLVVPVPLVASP